MLFSVSGAGAVRQAVRSSQRAVRCGTAIVFPHPIGGERHPEARVPGVHEGAMRGKEREREGGSDLLPWPFALYRA